MWLSQWISLKDLVSSVIGFQEKNWFVLFGLCRIFYVFQEPVLIPWHNSYLERLVFHHYVLIYYVKTNVKYFPLRYPQNRYNEGYAWIAYRPCYIEYEIFWRHLSSRKKRLQQDKLTLLRSGSKSCMASFC